MADYTAAGPDPSGLYTISTPVQMTDITGAVFTVLQVAGTYTAETLTRALGVLQAQVNDVQTMLAAIAAVAAPLPSPGDVAPEPVTEPVAVAPVISPAE